jgi:hypothetical protein
MNKNLKLIDDYISIYRLYYKCKLLNNKHNFNSINSLILRISNLKIEYEKIIHSNKLFDDSFILLKQQLDDAKSNQTQKEIPDITNIFNEVSNLEKTIYQLKNKNKKSKVLL